MHGLSVGVTWTYLDQKALAGDVKINLTEKVNWNIGSQIVIATTGDRFSKNENEVRTITMIEENQITLDSPLLYDHLSETRQLDDDVSIEIKAEVGLLTRNILFSGYNDPSWSSLYTAPACPEGFYPEEFAIQTCNTYKKFCFLNFILEKVIYYNKMKKVFLENMAQNKEPTNLEP